MKSLLLMLVLALLWSTSGIASDKGDLATFCKIAYRSNEYEQRSCNRRQTSARLRLRKLAASSFDTHGWSKEVNACYRASPAPGSGIDYEAALQCFNRERQRIIKEQNQPPPPKRIVKKRNQPVVPLNQGVPEDALQGDADAQNFLGFMYANGDDVPEDNVQAYAW